MTIRSQALGAEIVVPDDVNLKPLVKAMAEDAAKRQEHERMKSDPAYKRPVFPNEPYPYPDKSNWR